MNLALRDNSIKNISCIINERKKMLVEKYKQLKKAKEENIYIEDIVDDYKQYYNYIIEEKTKQYEAMEILKKYLDNISIDIDVTEQQLNENKEDKKRLMREMKKIKNDLDELIINK